MTRPSLEELLDATSPATRARQREAATAPVAAELAPLLPDGGLPRGAVTEVGDMGLLSQLAAMAAARQGVWSAVIDVPDFGDRAAAGAGIPIERLAHVPDSQNRFGDVLVTLAGASAFQLVICRPPAAMTERTAARLAAHLRTHGTVLLAYDHPWPGAELRLDVTDRRWRGPGDGWGQLMERQVRIECTGRRIRTTELLLPDDRGRLARPSELVFTDHRATATVRAQRQLAPGLMKTRSHRCRASRHNRPVDLPFLLAAVERGDDDAVLEVLFDATADERVGDDAVALLAAAARVGRQRVVDHLVLWDVDVTRPWDGGLDPVTWAAENGRFLVLQALLSRNDDPLSSDSPHRRALRIAQDALASGVGREADPPPAHWAIVTDMEAALGVRHSPDELMARALVHADPDHDDWFVSVFHLGTRTDRETFDWALEAARDTSGPDRRRFGINTMDQLAISFSLLSLPDDAALPFEREAEDFLRPLLRSEQDPRTLALVIGAFASYNNSGDTVAAVLSHAYHSDSGVRASVSTILHTNTARHQEALAALVHLAGDSVPVTRANALSKLLMSDVDTPELRALFTAHLTDPYFDAHLEAAASLALRGDERGQAALDEIRSGIKNMNSPGWGRLSTIDCLLRRRVEAAETTVRGR